MMINSVSGSITQHTYDDFILFFILFFCFCSRRTAGFTASIYLNFFSLNTTLTVSVHVVHSFSDILLLI